MKEKFCPRNSIIYIAKLSYLNKFMHECSTQWSKGFIGKCKKNIIRLNNAQIHNIGEIIDIHVTVMKEMPIMLFIAPHSSSHRMIHSAVAWKKHNNRLHIFIRHKNIIYGRLFIPNNIMGLLSRPLFQILRVSSDVNC